MVRFLTAWYRAKRLKYEMVTMSMETLRDKFQDNAGALTLTELVQFEYMGRQVASIIATSAKLTEDIDDAVPPPKEVPDTLSRMYL